MLDELARPREHKTAAGGELAEGSLTGAKLALPRRAVTLVLPVLHLEADGTPARAARKPGVMPKA